MQGYEAAHGNCAADGTAQTPVSGLELFSFSNFLQDAYVSFSI